jgi:histidine ammonia-lyase
MEPTMTRESIVLVPGEVSLSTLKRVFHGRDRIELHASARARVDKCSQQVQDIIDSDKVVYALNTGFGKFSQTRITAQQMELLQRNLITSHSTGVGEYLPDETVRLMMVLKVLALARGFSGIRYEAIECLLKFINAGVYPCIPAKGSVGASGDLAPLSHMAATMIGIGQMRVEGRIMPAAEGLRIAGVNVYRLGPKEGVALVNGTQTSTALALQGLFMMESAMAAAICAGAMSVEAAAGLHDPYDPRIHAARGQQGQMAVAAAILRLLRESGIREGNKNSGKVQDPYSLRCQAQVLGAVLDGMYHAARILTIESNGVSDSPLIFTDTGEVLSGGNFHAEPVAQAADVLAVAIAEAGAISERRLAMLMDSVFSGLPAFLIKEGGINSGFMNVQVTAAALASENKSLAHPASVDSIPTSAGQEDHVSMATFAARRTLDMAWNTTHIVACELLGAAQGIELRRPLKSSKAIEEIFAVIRGKVQFVDADRYMAPDINAVAKMVDDGYFTDKVGGILPSSSDSGLPALAV